MSSFINRIGEKGISNEGYEIEIIEYKGYDNICVEIQDEFKTKIYTDYKRFKLGQIKNPYYPSVCEKGYLGEGGYSYKTHPQIYKEWSNMLHRCYDKNIQKKRSTYIDCTACEEWYNFQNFAKWYEENYYEVKNEKMCLDKDILFKGNKIYSPQTCMFVPQRINNLFTKSNATRGEYPIGVCYHKRDDLLEVYCRIEKKQIYLGKYFVNEPFRAFTCYKNFKENYIKQVADEYKNLIPIKLYEALYRYEVEIND